MTSERKGPAGGIALFEAPDGQVRVEVRLDRETVWLTLNQMAELFGRDKSVISRHLRNVFESGELEREAVVAKNATTAADGKIYQVEYYNLDAIISVGYRVNSKRGTQFRIWATRTLRDHLLRGYTLHAQHLAEKGLAEVRGALDLMAQTPTGQSLVSDEGAAVLDLVRRYLASFHVLLAYDENRLPAQPAAPVAPRVVTLEEARAAIVALRRELARRGEADALFGQERGEGLAGIRHAALGRERCGRTGASHCRERPSAQGSACPAGVDPAGG